MRHLASGALFPLLVSLCLLTPALSAEAQTPRSAIDAPRALERAKVTEHLDEAIPDELVFRDHRGKAFKLSEALGRGPLVLTLAYYSCPMLCGLVLNAVADVVAKTEGWRLGEDFRALTVSFDPRDTAEDAASRRKDVLNRAGIAVDEPVWPFLTGPAPRSKALADALGFEFAFDEQQQEFVHAAVVFLIAPDGTIVRYLYGLQIDPKDFALALREARNGESRSAIDQVLLYCYRFDPDKGSYTLMAGRVMQLGGALTLVILAMILGGFWLRERRRGGVRTD